MLKLARTERRAAMDVTTWVHFFFGGLSICPDHQVENRDFETLTVPPGTVGFMFYSKLIMPFDHEGEQLEAISMFGHSKRHWFGYLYTAEMIAELVPDSDHLLAQMLEEGYEQLVLLVNGTWIVFEPLKELILPPTLIGINVLISESIQRSD